MIKVIVSICSVVFFLMIFSPCYAQPDGYQQFMLEIKLHKADYGRPEIVLNTKNYIVIIFGAEKTMKKIVYNKDLDNYKVWDIRKFKTSSASDTDPVESLKKAIKNYE